MNRAKWKRKWLNGKLFHQQVNLFADKVHVSLSLQCERER